MAKQITPAGWEVVIGLETHAQLSTASKIFSGASTSFGAAPNVNAAAVDCALPGVLPVLNKGAVERAIRFGLAVGAKIADKSIFARKNYFYPDLPKGYQISQYEIPVVQGGALTITVDGQEKVVNLTRAHLEEDAGKSLHEDFAGQSGIDLNRAGTPLLEIVTEPEMRSAAEAVAYAKKLHSIVTWIGICDGNMQEGSFRCDANVSVRPIGQVEFGTRCEIKNLNSFKFMEEAINYEVTRQIHLIEDGGKVVQETRLYDPDKRETRSMRSKEDAQDYRYFPDPDLLPLVITAQMKAEIAAQMTELPEAMCARFETNYGLSNYDARALTNDRATATYFEACVAALPTAVREANGAKLVANWMTGEVASALNREEISISQSNMTAESLAWLITIVADGTVNGKTAKDEIFPIVWKGTTAAVLNVNAPEAQAIFSGGMDIQWLKDRGYVQISDTGALDKIIDEVLAANVKSVEEFRAGKEKAFNALIGQAMKATKGKANPAQVNELLKKRLGG